MLISFDANSSDNELASLINSPNLSTFSIVSVNSEVSTVMFILISLILSTSLFSRLHPLIKIQRLGKRYFYCYLFSVALGRSRSEEHTSELQSRGHLVCR